MKTVVAVLRGGPSSEYDVSLKTGAAVLSELNKDKYDARDVFISRDGQWHLRGIPATPEKALRGVDVAFNALHGEYGEDGRVSHLLETLRVPYSGSNPSASAVAFNKHHTKEALRRVGVKTPLSRLVSPTDDIEKTSFELFRSFPMPAVIKPVIGGSSVGTTIAKDIFSLQSGLEHAFTVAPKALVEEFIRGREATVGIIDHFRGDRAYALLPVEIIPHHESPFFDYEAKYSGKSQEICPGNFSRDEKTHLMQAARAAHLELGLSHYSRSDFIVSKRGIYFLEVNTLPGLTKESLLPKALQAIGAKFSDFLDHVLNLARLGKK